MENNNKNNGVPTLNIGSDLGADLNHKGRPQNITENKPKIFQERLKKRRKQFGHTQKTLAKVMGIDEGTIQNYEKGTWPKGDYAVLLAKFLECSLDWLLRGIGPEPPAPKTMIVADTILTPEYRAHHAAEAAERIKQHKEYFKLHGDWQPPEIKISVELSRTITVLESNTVYSTALLTNINAFYQAVKSGEEIKKLVDRVESLENQMKQWVETDREKEERRRNGPETPETEHRDGADRRSAEKNE